MLNSHILPAWRDREFVGIRRSDITKLMDRVQDKHGARAADYVLNVFSAIAQLARDPDRRLRAADRQRHAPPEHQGASAEADPG